MRELGCRAAVHCNEAYTLPLGPPALPVLRTMIRRQAGPLRAAAPCHRGGQIRAKSPNHEGVQDSPEVMVRGQKFRMRCWQLKGAGPYRDLNASENAPENSQDAVLSCRVRVVEPAWTNRRMHDGDHSLRSATWGQAQREHRPMALRAEEPRRAPAHDEGSGYG